MKKAKNIIINAGAVIVVIVAFVLFYVESMKYINERDYRTAKCGFYQNDTTRHLYLIKNGQQIRIR